MSVGIGEEMTAPILPSRRRFFVNHNRINRLRDDLNVTRCGIALTSLQRYVWGLGTAGNAPVYRGGLTESASMIRRIAFVVSTGNQPHPFGNIAQVR